MCHCKVSKWFVPKPKHCFTHVFWLQTFRTHIKTFVLDFILKVIRILQEIVNSILPIHISLHLFEFSFINIHGSLCPIAHDLFKTNVLKASTVLYLTIKVQSQKHWTFICRSVCECIGEHWKCHVDVHIDFVQEKFTSW